MSATAGTSPATPSLATKTAGCRFVARADDMIISAGYNIAGPEVEAALLGHPDVAECAVIGAPDEERGQIVSAFIVLKQGARSDDVEVKLLQDHVKATDRALQISPRGRLRRGAAERRRPGRSSASSCARPVESRATAREAVAQRLIWDKVSVRRATAGCSLGLAGREDRDRSEHQHDADHGECVAEAPAPAPAASRCCRAPRSPGAARWPGRRRRG